MERLIYTDSDGAGQVVRRCRLTQDKAGRYWLWSETLERNLAYKMRTKEDCLMQAIDSLLFTIQLKNERINGLQRIADLAYSFAAQISTDTD